MRWKEIAGKGLPLFLVRLKGEEATLDIYLIEVMMINGKARST
jgi:hypothetical protein